jgi:hypothetical protein
MPRKPLRLDLADAAGLAERIYRPGLNAAASDRLILHGDASPADAPFALQAAVLFLLFRRSAPTSAAEKKGREPNHTLRTATDCLIGLK